MRTPSFYSDPHVQFLSQLLEEVSEGHLQVPRFQRPMVWSWDARLELLRSIRDGIPIGAIMVWRTSSTEIDCYEFLGPHRLTQPQPGATRQYLLDGVQRLSTLYGALHQLTAPAEYGDSEHDSILGASELNRSTNFSVFVDLTRRDFCTPSIDDITSDMMPLHVVFDSVALLRFQRQLVGDGFDDLVAASDQMARAFRDYKIPIIPITTDDVDMATRTFQRINSQGIQMSEAHMVHALTWNPAFNLNSKLGEINDRILQPILWESLDPDIILKACKAGYDLNVYRSSGQELSDAIRAKPHVIDEVGVACGRAASFLREQCGVPLPDLVPYSLQTVILIDAFRIQPNPSPSVTKLLRSWFWMTTYGELFASMSGDRLNTMINDVREMIASGLPVWTWKRPFEVRPISTFDFRTARSKALAFRLADSMNRVLGGEAGTQILTDAGKKGLVQILPWFRSERNTFSSPANRFLSQPADVGTLRDAILQGSLSTDLQIAHMISDQAMSMLSNGYYDLFVGERLKDIQQFEDSFVSPLVQPFLRVRK